MYIVVLLIVKNMVLMEMFSWLSLVWFFENNFLIVVSVVGVWLCGYRLFVGRLCCVVWCLGMLKLVNGVLCVVCGIEGVNLFVLCFSVKVCICFNCLVVFVVLWLLIMIWMMWVLGLNIFLFVSVICRLADNLLIILVLLWIVVYRNFRFWLVLVVVLFIILMKYGFQV